MKSFIVIIACVISLSLFGQNHEPEFDGKKWDAPYTFNIPEGWGVERFPIPISFAPGIKYKGVEDIRFSPGWGKTESNEYWTYAFLWYLNGEVKTNAKTIENNLMIYYTGLLDANLDPLKIPAGEWVPVTTKIKKVKAEGRDIKTFKGSIHMFDYIEYKPITLNCIVHLSYCKELDKTVLFYELSPRPFSDQIWQSLNQLWSGFGCDKALRAK